MMYVGRRDLGEARAAPALRLVARLALADARLGRLEAVLSFLPGLGLLRPALVPVELLHDVRGRRRFSKAEEEEGAREACHGCPSAIEAAAGAFFCCPGYCARTEER